MPSAIRRRLGLTPGDEFTASIRAHRIVLTPDRRITSGSQARFGRNAVTGLPVVDTPATPLVDTAKIADALADFP